MPGAETPRQKKHASNPESSGSIEAYSNKSVCTRSRTLAWRTPVALRPIVSTRSTSPASRHSRRTPCPTMPVAPKIRTFTPYNPGTAGMFVIELVYKADLAEIDAHMKAHIRFLRKYYDSGHFLVSGRKIPRDGGIILAVAESRREIEAI